MKLNKSLTLSFLSITLIACEPSKIGLDSQSTITTGQGSQTAHGNFQVISDDYPNGGIQNGAIEKISTGISGTGTVNDPVTVPKGQNYNLTWNANVSEAAFMRVSLFSPENPDVPINTGSNVSCIPESESNECAGSQELNCLFDGLHLATGEVTPTPVLNCKYGEHDTMSFQGAKDAGVVGIKYSLCGPLAESGCDLAIVGYIKHIVEE